MKEGDIVFHTLNRERKMIVTGVCSNGEIRCSYFDANGASLVAWFFPYEVMAENKTEEKVTGFK